MEVRFRSFMSLVALAAFLYAPIAFAQSEDEDDDDEEDEDAEAVEEVRVTGSFIPRDNFDLPSPIHVTTELDIELAGTPDMGDIIFDQTFQFGVNANAAPFEGDAADDQQWNQGAEVWANIRGLGTRATMTMMDSHRLPADTNTWGRRTGVDVTNTYPQIAIGRVETILDGASALYGAEAVAGVINMIPNKDFEGLRMNYNNSQAIEDGAPNQGISLLAGAQGERTKALFSIEVRDVAQMRVTSRPDYIISVVSPWEHQRPGPAWHDAGQRSNPADWWVPFRGHDGERIQVAEPHGTDALADAQGAFARAIHPDPGCGYGFGAGHDDWGEVPEGEDPSDGIYVYNDLAKHGSFLNGTPSPWDANRCIMTLADMQDMQGDQETWKGFTFFEHEFNDWVKVHGEVVTTTYDYYTRDVTGGLDEIPTNTIWGSRVPIVIGTNPGNPFRAIAHGSWYDPATGQISVRTAKPPASQLWRYRDDPFASEHITIPDGNRWNITGLDWEDTNGNGLYDYLEEPGELYVYAQDANGDGIPDRSWDGSDETGIDGTGGPDGIPDADQGAQRQPEARVILLSAETDSDGDGIPDRFDPDMHGNGGVRLFEDVRMVSGDLNINPKQARNNTIEYLDEDGGMLTYRRRAQRDNVRFRLGTEVTIPDTDWIVNADYVYARGKRERQYPEPQWWLFVDALRCQGGDEGNHCWNPFSTTYLMTTDEGQFIGDESIKWPSDDDPGWRPFDDPAVNTEIENRHAGMTLEYNLQTLGMDLFDLVGSTGNLFSLPYNDAAVGFAIGFHHRLETEEYRSSVINQSGLGGGNRGLRVSGQESNAIFAEIHLPVIQHETWGEMEIWVASRYAEIHTYGEIGQPGEVTFTTTIPKFSLRYSPTEWVAVRASLTEGFVTPGLYALFGEPGQYGGQRASGTSSQANVGDYICDELPELTETEECTSSGQSAFATNVLTFGGPNSDLGAEFSELWNAGVSFNLLGGDLVIDVDYTNVEFNGKAEQMSATVNVNSNRIGFEDFMLAQCPGTVLDWDNVEDVTPETHPEFFTTPDPDDPMGNPRRITAQQFLQLFPEDAACRVRAATEWVNTVEQGFGIGNSRVQRGGGVSGLGLTLADLPWVQNGSQFTETMIYGLRYSFEAEDLPFIGGDFGSFAFSLSATQLLEMSNILYDANSGHPLAGIRVDAVGNRNQGGGGTPVR